MAPNYTLKFVFPLFQDDKERKGNPNILFFNHYDFHISTISIPNYLICTFASFTQEVFWLHSPNYLLLTFFYTSLKNI